MKNNDKLVEAVKQAEQQQAQMQQQQAQSQMQVQQAQVELSQARAVADRGLGLERVSRVQENQALATERRAAAVKDQEQGSI